MSSTRTSFGLALLLATHLACEKREPPPTETPPAPPTVAPPSPTPPPMPEPAPPLPGDAEDPPTEEDFEQEFEKEINAGNLDAQLDALEKEILAE